MVQYRLDDTPEVRVPKDRLFVMGDNRDNSADSRVPVDQGGVGLLPVDNLVGRVDAIVGSWDFATRSRPVWASRARIPPDSRCAASPILATNRRS